MHDGNHLTCNIFFTYAKLSAAKNLDRFVNLCMISNANDFSTPKKICRSESTGVSDLPIGLNFKEFVFVSARNNE